MAKLKLYFSCSVRGGRDDQNLYRELIDIFTQKYEVLTKHLGLKNLSEAEKKQSDEDIYLQDKGYLEEADLLIAECSTPSIGVGYELAYAEKRGIPCIVLSDTRREKRLSAMISGDHYFRKIYYSSEEELMEIAEKL